MSGATGVIAGAAVAGTVASVSSANRAGKQQQAAMNQQQDAMNRQADIAERQQDMAEEQWARYKETYQPIEDEFIKESRGLGSIANQNKAATNARADVAGAFSQARDQLNRTPGANPTSQAYLQEQNRLNLAEAATSAASQTGARTAQVDKGRAAMADVVNMGKGLPASAASGLSGAASTTGSMSGIANSMYTNSGNQYANQMGAINSFSNAVGGLAKNPTVQSWGSGLSNWMSGTPTIQGAPITITPDMSGQQMVMYS